MSQPPLFAEERNLFMGGFFVSENIRIRLGMMEEKPERRQVRPKKSVEWEKAQRWKTSSTLSLPTKYKWTVGSLLYVGDYTTQLHRDYNKPLSL